MISNKRYGPDDSNVTVSAISLILSRLLHSGRSQVEARLKEDLRDVEFEHGEEVSYETSGGHRHRAIIVHSARSDPSALHTRNSSMLDDTTIEEPPQPRRAPPDDGDIKPLGRQPYPLGDWNLRFPGYNFDSFVLLRQRGLALKPSRSQQRHAAMSPYVLDEGHNPPYLPNSSPTAPTVSIVSSRGNFHNGYAPTAAFEPRGGFPSRMMSPPPSSSNHHQQSSVHSHELRFQGSSAYPGYSGAGNTYGRPLQHPGGGFVLPSSSSLSSGLLPQPLSGHMHTSSPSSGGGGGNNPLSSAFSPIADEGWSDRLLRDRPRSSPSSLGHKLAFGVDPTTAAAACSTHQGYVPPPGRELRLPRTNTSGGFYFAVPDHTLAAAAFTHTGGFTPSASGRSSPHHPHSRAPADKGGGFERFFGVGAAVDGAPPREAMPASFWVFGARRHDRNAATSSGHPGNANNHSGVAFPASPLHALKESLKVKPNPNVVGGQYMVAAAPPSSSLEVGELPAGTNVDNGNGNIDAGAGLGVGAGEAQWSLEDGNSSAPVTPLLGGDSKGEAGGAANASFYANGSLEGVHVPREQSTPGHTMIKDSLVALEQARQFARDIIHQQDYSNGGGGLNHGGGGQQKQKQRPHTAGPLGRSDHHFNSNGQAHAVSLLAQVRSSLPYDPRPKEESYGFDPLLFPKRAAEWDATRKAHEKELQARAQQAGQHSSSKHKNRRRPASASANLTSNSNNNPAARREQALAAASKARAEAAGANLKKFTSSSGGNARQKQQQPEAPQTSHWASSSKPITRSPAGAAGGSAARAAKFLKHRKVLPVGATSVGGKPRAGTGGVAGKAFGHSPATNNTNNNKTATGSDGRARGGNVNSGSGGVAVGRGVASYGISGALKWAQGRSEQQVSRRSERIVEGLATSADFLAATQSLVERSVGDSSSTGWGLPHNVALPQGSIGTAGSWGVLLRTDEPATGGASPNKQETLNPKTNAISPPSATKKQQGSKGRPQTAPGLRMPLAMGTVQLVNDDTNDNDGPAQEETALHGEVAGSDEQGNPP